MRRTLVLADLHLTTFTPKAATQDLVRVVREHPGARLVFAGDLFDTSAEGPVGRSGKPPRALDALEAWPDVRAALGEHVDRGGELWLVCGNHDGEIGAERFEDDLASSLRVGGGEARGRLRTTPWFFREGAVHIEHGHLYDPDNAPAHPLASGAKSLGVHFVEQFIAPTGAYAYLNANDGTPLKMFLSSFKWYGLRAPYVIYRYFHAAFGALLESGPFFQRALADAETSVRGSERLARFADDIGVPPELATALLDLAATPTLVSMRRTFARLYLDRVGASLMMAGGAAFAATGSVTAGTIVFGVGAAVMASSWAAGHDRYAGAVATRLQDSAADVAAATGAKLVVFGHTHREAHASWTEGAYANTGSFSFPRGAPGRPFLEIEGSPESPRAVRRYLC